MFVRWHYKHEIKDSYPLMLLLYEFLIHSRPKTGIRVSKRAMEKRLLSFILLCYLERQRIVCVVLPLTLCVEDAVLVKVSSEDAAALIRLYKMVSKTT